MHRAINHLKRRPSKLRNRDGDTDVNRCGGWSRERLEQMDAKFVAAMQRAMTARKPQATMPPRGGGGSTHKSRLLANRWLPQTTV